MPLDGTPMPRASAPAASPARRRRHAPRWRGAAGAIALAGWSVAGVLGAVLALVPLALERGPRGRAVSARPDRAVLRLGAPHPAAIADADVAAEAGAEADATEPVKAARAAGEAFPG